MTRPSSQESAPKGIKPYSREWSVLIEMYGANWVRPMDIGATDGSWHSGVLSRLVKRGLVERQHRFSHRAYVYRLTETGKKIAFKLRYPPDVR